MMRSAAAATSGSWVTEMSVARLVVGGLTSREIGGQLSISRRTVETHLAHIYGKLGLSSRVQLATAYTEVPGARRARHRRGIGSRPGPGRASVSRP